jgi:hypothetical protein
MILEQYIDAAYRTPGVEEIWIDQGWYKRLARGLFGDWSIPPSASLDKFNFPSRSLHSLFDYGRNATGGGLALQSVLWFMPE